MSTRNRYRPHRPARGHGPTLGNAKGGAKLLPHRDEITIFDTYKVAKVGRDTGVSAVW